MLYDICSLGIPDASTDDDSVSHPLVHPCGVSDMKGWAGKRFNIGVGQVMSAALASQTPPLMMTAFSHHSVHPCGVSDMTGQGR